METVIETVIIVLASFVILYFTNRFAYFAGERRGYFIVVKRLGIVNQQFFNLSQYMSEEEFRKIESEYKVLWNNVTEITERDPEELPLPEKQWYNNPKQLSWLLIHYGNYYFSIDICYDFAFVDWMARQVDRYSTTLSDEEQPSDLIG